MLAIATYIASTKITLKLAKTNITVVGRLSHRVTMYSIATTKNS